MSDMKTGKPRLTESFRLSALVVAFSLLWCIGTARGAEDAWPRRMDTAKYVITIYQPQLESIEGDRLTGRAALSVTEKTKKTPVFGVVWMRARMDTDRNNRVATFHDIKVTDVRFPEVTEEQKQQLREILEKQMAEWETTTSLDRIVTAVEALDKEKRGDEALRNSPPRIIFMPRPSVLVLIDGDPRMVALEQTSYMRVVNTPFLIVYDPSTKIHYLRGGTVWLTASDIKGPWKEAESVPDPIKALGEVKKEADKKDSGTKKAEKALDLRPEVIVSTEPAELIAADGEPEWSTISGTNLLYMSNTESNVFLYTTSQQYFALLSGRWFSTKSLTDGPWSYVEPHALPADFAKIPPDSVKGFVLVSVPTTTQAKDAVADTYIPQTAVIDRKTATTEVKYDGDPRFEAIEGTNLQYAVNTTTPTFLSGTKYYAVESGIWYEADSPTGPWRVSVAPPADVNRIPPSNPHYNVKYTKVYDYTDDVAYVGYTSGYTGSYVDNGTVVYGTGYAYPSYQSTNVYYPYPATYGYAATYNPYGAYWGYAPAYYNPVTWFTAAAVGVASAAIWASVWDDHHHWYGGGWWGRGGYNYNNINHIHNNVVWNRPGYRPGGWRPGDRYPGYGRPGDWRPGDRYPGYGRPGVGQRPGLGRPGVGTLPARPNLYDRPGVSDRLAGRDRMARPGRGEPGAALRPGGIEGRPGARPDARPGVRPGGRPETRPGRESVKMTRPATRDAAANNVFADREGNVLRRDAKGNWQQRDQGRWASVSGDQAARVGAGKAGRGGVSRPAQQPRTNANIGSLNRDASSRYRGAERAQSFNQAKSQGGGGRGAFSRSSGGGGRSSGGAAFRGGGGGGGGGRSISRGGGASRGGGMSRGGGGARGGGGRRR